MCEVWWASPALERPWHLDLLDDAERGRRESLHQAADRARFTVGAALLRLVAASLTDRPAGAVVVDRHCARCGRPHGRPRIADLHVNVSHSGDLVAVAVSRAGPVGVDVEQIVDVDVAGLSSVVLAPDETADERSGFFTYWTRKEAVVKATGDGLLVPLNEVRVTPPDAAPGLVSYPGRALTVQLRDLAPGAGYAAALAVIADAPVEVRERSGEALLASA
jgi:4'-phosphopantetheinyl transferase